MIAVDPGNRGDRMETHLSYRCDVVVMSLWMLSWFGRGYVLVGMCERDREVLHGGEGCV